MGWLKASYICNIPIPIPSLNFNLKNYIFNEEKNIKQIEFKFDEYLSNLKKINIIELQKLNLTLY